jgi:hypothetical protein
MGTVAVGSAPLDPALVEMLDAFRRAKFDLQRYVETRNDEAFLFDLAAGINRRLGGYAVREANEHIPPVQTDPDTRF